VGGGSGLDEEGAGDGAWALLEDLWAEEKDGGRWKVSLGVVLKEMVSLCLQEVFAKINKSLIRTGFQGRVRASPSGRFDPSSRYRSRRHLEGERQRSRLSSL